MGRLPNGCSVVEKNSLAEPKRPSGRMTEDGA
jgi:hypothetical protein